MKKQPAMKDATPVYLVILEGGGDTYIKVVDAETFAWVTSDDPGKPPADSEEYLYEWPDQLVPPSQVAKLKSEDPDNLPLHITSGSWENDRAIAALPADGYDTYDSVREAMADIRHNKHVLTDEYHGCMY